MKRGAENNFRGILAVLALLLFIVNACNREDGDNGSGIYGTFVDPEDGSVYRTIQIGAQVWLAGNINRGEMINGSNDQKDNGKIEKYCYDNNPALCNRYGGLYQWDEAMQYSTEESAQGICPTGWHIPSDSEWKILEIYLGMSRGAADDILWRGVDQGLLILPGGVTGFEALRAGNRFLTGSFNEIGNSGYLWTSTTADDGHAWRRGVHINEKGIYRSVNHKSFGFSVRCIRY